jgi:hypothetical protein
MKIIINRTLLPLLAVALLMGCSHKDDDPAADDILVQYRVNVDQPIIENISYRQADGQVVAEVEPLHETTLWHTTEYIDEPFDAHKEVRFFNDGTVEVPYKLSLFVGGHLVEVKEGLVQPQAVEIALLQYSVLD